MHRLGVAAAVSGLPFEASRVDAQAIAQVTGLVRDYGDYPALRNYDRGYWAGAELLLDGFGWQTR